MPIGFLTVHEPGDKAKLQRQSVQIREELVGYVDALVQRQDRTNMFSKLETFQVEAAARRSVRELISGFEQQYKHTISRLETVDECAARCREEQAVMREEQEKILGEQQANQRWVDCTKNLEAELANLSSQSQHRYSSLDAKIDQKINRLQAQISQFPLLASMHKQNEKGIEDVMQTVYNVKTALHE